MINPREDDGNLGKMIFFHKRYTLGDKHTYADKDAFLADLLSTTLNIRESLNEAYKKMVELRKYYKSEQMADEALVRMIREKFVILPVYGMDHGSFSVSTFDFNDKWDSGLLGWIYVDREEAIQTIEYAGENHDHLIEDILKNEVSAYDDYLQGGDDED